MPNDVRLPLERLAPFRAPRRESEVRLRATGFAALIDAPRREPADEVDAALVEELGDEQLALEASLVAVDAALASLPRDPSAHAAAQSIRERVADLRAVRGALAAIYLDGTDPRMARALGHDAPLADYLRGICAWTKVVTRALADLVIELRHLTPDWAHARERIEDAASFYLPELEPLIVRDIARLRMRAPAIRHPSDPLADLDAHLAELFVAASVLARNLERRFG